MENEKYECPKCNAVFEKNNHYKKTLELINLPSLGIEIDEVVDFCGKCNHFEYKQIKP